MQRAFFLQIQTMTTTKLPLQLRAMSKSLLLFLLFLPLLTLAKTSAEGLAWLEKNAKQPNVISSHGGYQYKILQKGYGVEHPASGQARVRCHFAGSLTDGTVFESTYTHEKAKEFRPIDAHDGWFAPLMDMVEGDIYELYLPSELTKFGDEGGVDGKVKGGDVVVYRLELVRIVGETISALKCSVAEPDKDCNPKEKKYMKKVLAMTKEEMSKELARHSNVLENEELEPMIANWTHRRIYILKQAIEAKKEEKEDVEFTCDVNQNRRETCNAKELDYISKALERKDTVLSKHLEVYAGQLDKGGLEPELEDWTRRQVHILKQIITGEEEKVFSMKHVLQHMKHVEL